MHILTLTNFLDAIAPAKGLSISVLSTTLKIIKGPIVINTGFPWKEILLVSKDILWNRLTDIST